MPAEQKDASNGQLSQAEQIDQQVAALDHKYVDSHGTIWTAYAVHYNESHYIRYSATVDGDSATISGPHQHMGYFSAHRDLGACGDLLRSLGNDDVSNLDETDLEKAIEWVYQAPDLVEAAVKRHFYRARIEAALNDLDQEKADSIEAINQQYTEKAARVYEELGLTPAPGDVDLC